MSYQDLGRRPRPAGNATAQPIAEAITPGTGSAGTPGGPASVPDSFRCPSCNDVQPLPKQEVERLCGCGLYMWANAGTLWTWTA
jgi:rubredoxin